MSGYSRTDIMLTVGDEVLNSCRVVHLVMDDVEYATTDDIRIFTRFCNVALRDASVLRVLKVTGRIKEKDTALIDQTLFTLRLIDEVYFDCHFIESGHFRNTNRSLRDRLDFWGPKLQYWHVQNRRITFYFNVSKLSPEYVRTFRVFNAINFGDVRFYQ